MAKDADENDCTVTESIAAMAGELADALINEDQEYQS